MIQITIGAPKIAVTELMDNSVGANMVLAIRSENRQNTAPPRKQAGVIRIGFVVFNMFLTRCGTAIPTNEIGPAKAVTVAERMLESNISQNRNQAMFTPRFCA